MSVVAETQAPMDDEQFDERLWEAAKNGTADDPPGQEGEGATGTPDATETPQNAADSPAAPQSQAPAEDAPPTYTAEQVERWQQAERQLASVQGNVRQVAERLVQEQLTPVQQEAERLRQEREAWTQREKQYQEYLISLQPQQTQQQIRASLAEQERQQHEAAFQQQQQVAQQQLAAQQQAIRAQEAEVARVMALTTIPSYMDELSTQFGVPREELDAFDRNTGFTQQLRTLPPQQIGARIQALTDYAQNRGALIAQENAARAAASGTYRTETGAGASGQDRASNLSKMNDADFSSLWERVKAGYTGQ